MWILRRVGLMHILAAGDHGVELSHDAGVYNAKTVWNFPGLPGMPYDLDQFLRQTNQISAKYSLRDYIVTKYSSARRRRNISSKYFLKRSWQRILQRFAATYTCCRAQPPIGNTTSISQKYGTRIKPAFFPKTPPPPIPPCCLHFQENWPYSLPLLPATQRALGFCAGSLNRACGRCGGALFGTSEEPNLGLFACGSRFCGEELQSGRALCAASSPGGAPSLLPASDIPCAASERTRFPTFPPSWKNDPPAEDILLPVAAGAAPRLLPVGATPSSGDANPPEDGAAPTAPPAAPIIPNGPFSGGGTLAVRVSKSPGAEEDRGTTGSIMPPGPLPGTKFEFPAPATKFEFPIVEGPP